MSKKKMASLDSSDDEEETSERKKTTSLDSSDDDIALAHGPFESTTVRKLAKGTVKPVEDDDKNGHWKDVKTGVD